MISVGAFKNLRYVWHFGGFRWDGVADLPLISSDMSVFHKPMYIMVFNCRRRSSNCLFEEVIDMSHLDVFSICFSSLNKS